MLIAHVADSHYDERSRFEECKRLHHWIADDAAERGVELTVHSGDVYERKSTPLERQAAAGFFQRMATLGPVVIARGNHDAIDDLPLLERLETRNPIHVVERAEVFNLAGVAFAVLGWPQRGHLQAALSAAGVDASKEAVEIAAGDALRALLRGMGDQLAEFPLPKILVAHAMVRGSVTSTGQPLVGCDFEIGLEDLALVNADAYLLGHVHKGQAWKIGDAPCLYPGSPRRSNFGETEAKGYTVVEVDEHGVIGCEFVEVPATPMLHLADEWGVDSTGEGWLAGLHFYEGPESVRGAEVRFRYTVAADRRDAAAAAAQRIQEALMGHGALHVKLEEVVSVQTRARTPEVAAAVTLADKMQALWTAQKFEPGDRREPLLAKLSTIEEEARNAA